MSKQRVRASQNEQGQKVAHGLCVPLMESTGSDVGCHVSYPRDDSPPFTHQPAQQDDQERYCSIFERNFDAAYCLDLDGHLTAVNSAAQALSGLSHRLLVGMHFSQLAAPDQVQALRQAFARCRKGESVELESALIRKDGQRVDIRITSGPILENGQITGVFGIARDITHENIARRAMLQSHNDLELHVAHRTAELALANERLTQVAQRHERSAAALRESEERFRALFENTSVGVCIVDPHQGRRFVNVNPAMERIFGYARAKMLTMTVDEVTVDEGPSGRDQYDQIVEGSISATAIEKKYRRADGRIIYGLVAVSSFRDRRGRFFTIGIVQDITEQKRVAANLRQLQKEITDLTTDEQRRIGQELHDSLGGLLTGLLYMAKSLAGHTASNPASPADIVRRLEQGLNEAMEQCRLIARGLIPVEFADGGLAEALDALAARTAAMPDITCHLACDPQACHLDRASATHLFRIAQEAVSNSLRHGKARCIEIELAVEGATITLRVTDDGRGLPPDADRGQGLGLRIMKHRAALIGGQLTVRALESGGTLVLCRLNGELGVGGG